MNISKLLCECLDVLLGEFNNLIDVNAQVLKQSLSCQSLLEEVAPSPSMAFGGPAPTPMHDESQTFDHAQANGQGVID